MSKDSSASKSASPTKLTDLPKNLKLNFIFIYDYLIR